ncbi:MAG: hypothetical protein P4L22_01565 [Candidatus Babeliales bacterium]|nr:hypothetical protein [Candidatus Babeliales bacterium]
MFKKIILSIAFGFVFFNYPVNNIKKIRKLDQKDMGNLIYYLDLAYRDNFQRGFTVDGLPKHSLNFSGISEKVICIGQDICFKVRKESWKCKIEAQQLRCTLIAGGFRRYIRFIREIYKTKFGVECSIK